MNILITGGASGLGEAITRKLALTKDDNIYFTYNTSKAKAEQLLKEHPNTSAIKCDFKNDEEVISLTSKIDSLGINVLINNAYHGDFIKSHFHKTPPSDFLENFKTNVIPTIQITQAAINCFRKQKSGNIITILTAALSDPPIGSSAYVAGKAYLQKLAKAWSIENTKYNITSNTVSPSFMLTKLTGNIDERMIEQIRENQPSKKLLTVEEVADAVHSLVIASPSLNDKDITFGSNASKT